MRHYFLDLDGVKIFVRESGAETAPVLLAPHGYPCSSYQFRNLGPLLADRWRVIAPDFPGCGYSDTPDHFAYTFDGYADFLERLLVRMDVRRFALYLHDFGSQIGLRLAMRKPERIAALIIQNGDIYQDQFGPKYQGLMDFFRKPTPEGQANIAGAVSREGFREEFLNDVGAELAELISPDLWNLHWALTTPRRKEIAVGLITGLRDNLNWFPRYQAYLREHRPPALIVWGPRDGYMPEGAASAYLRDLPAAELHLLDGGHWLLETHLAETTTLVRNFLERHCPGT
jgi:pimeloyl-ACP methyl ester carboxylesterase